MNEQTYIEQNDLASFYIETSKQKRKVYIMTQEKDTHTHDTHEQGCHNHDHGHDHDHNHGNVPVILYFIGLSLALIGLVVSGVSSSVANVLFSVASLTAGYHVVILEGIGETIENTKRRQRFTPNSHILMGLAAVGASLIGSFWEGTLLILIFSGAHFLESYAEGKSKREISQLLKLNPTTARRIEADGTTQVVDVAELHIGDRLQVLHGDQVPIDGRIVSGTSTLDEASITGESMPREKTAGDEVFGSTINLTDTLVIEVTKKATDTVFSKILQLVNQNQNNQTKVSGVIQRFMPTYVKAVLLLVPLVMVGGPLLFSWTWSQSIYRGLTLLVTASPCALAAATVSVTLSTTSNLASKGVLSKGSAYLSQLADIQAIAFDKTGTLTKGQPEVTDYQFSEAVEESHMIDILVALEKESNHPLATAMIQAFEPTTILTLETDNQIGKGVQGTHAGDLYRIGKPSSFENVSEVYTRLTEEWARTGKTVVYMSENEQIVGIVALMDVPSDYAKEAIVYFKQAGIHTTLITGDSELTGQAVGKQLGVDQVKANVMPEDKSTLIQTHQEMYGVTAMVGDGINDAPALVKADVGIAMGQGTDVAVDVSDLILMHNDLSKLVQAHKLSVKMNRVIWQNIIFSMTVVAVLSVTSLFGLTGIAASVVLHEGSTFVVILNGLRLLRGK